MIDQRKIVAAAAVALACLLSDSGLADRDPTAPSKFGFCYWEGTPPICSPNSCRPGYVIRDRQECISGYRIRCCEPLGHVSQGQKKKQQNLLLKYRNPANSKNKNFLIKYPIRGIRPKLRGRDKNFMLRYPIRRGPNG